MAVSSSYRNWSAFKRSVLGIELDARTLLSRLKRRRQDASIAISRMPRPPHLLGITCAGKSDGGGAQVLAVMSAIVFAKAVGLPYFHTPFSSVAHSETPGSFANQWESAFNLGRGFEPVPDNVPIITSDVFLDGYCGPPAILRQPHFHAFCDRNAHLYSHHAAAWRENLALPTVPHTGETIAVHVRRGDVSAADRYRYTSNRDVCIFIESVRARRPGARTIILSEGQESDFYGLPPYCEYQLGTDIFETIAIMIQAEYFIMAKSALSYVCGILSTGSVYYEKFSLRPLPSWQLL